MNLSTSAQCSSHASKENIPSNKADAPPVQRAKQRAVLGVLSENEQRGQSLSQGSQFSKHSSITDSSHLNFLGCASTSSYDVYVEEACEVVLTTSGQEVVSGGYDLDHESAALENEDLKILLELSLSPCQDASMQSDESLMSEEVWRVSEYAEDIHQHLRESETKMRVKPGYLEKHPEITSDMRVILVDWLVDVVREYKLGSETLHLAVNYVDRFLSCTEYLKRSKLQLVGTAALLIAAKYEETVPPELDEYVYITDCTYTKEQLVHMELILMKVLGFRMGAPTANQFLCLFMSIHSVCAVTENLSLYIAELSLLEMDPFLQYSPSLVAAGVYCLATYTVNKCLWPDSLNAFTGYTMADIGPCLTNLHMLYISADSRPQQAMKEKYNSSKYCRVSSITPPAVLPFL